MSQRRRRSSRNPTVGRCSAFGSVRLRRFSSGRGQQPLPWARSEVSRLVLPASLPLPFGIEFWIRTAVAHSSDPSSYANCGVLGGGRCTRGERQLL
ncbi:hypothetical protein AAHA92_04686 [Salvia divinorum]|uniref:Uncharacterized protein n=1 Tax=Salvia divinorum TaxID=28513 RepID=A0ABD1I0Z9_SALDI